MSKEKFSQILCVVFLAVFILILLVQNGGSSKTGEEVFTPVIESFEIGELKVRDDKTIKKEFSFGEEDVENIVYISSDSIMEVRELLLVETKSKDDVQKIVESIQSRVDSKKALFKNYAPEQSALLENYVLVKKGKFVLYVVSDSPQPIVKAFKKAL